MTPGETYWHAGDQATYLGPSAVKGSCNVVGAYMTSDWAPVMFDARRLFPTEKAAWRCVLETNAANARVRLTNSRSDLTDAEECLEEAKATVTSCEKELADAEARLAEFWKGETP